jgi:hypothetical protein
MAQKTLDIAFSWLIGGFLWFFISNTKGTYPDNGRNFRNIILAITGKNELTKEEEEDIK